MPVALKSRVRRSDVGARALRAKAQKLLELVGHRQATLSLTLVGDAAMRTLNRRHRGLDRPTDVLSFPMHEARELRHSKAIPLLGDVVISVDAARRQAAAYDAPLARELERLLIHGILHLIGHDHVRSAERARMEREERRLASAIGMPWPY